MLKTLRPPESRPHLETGYLPVGWKSGSITHMKTFFTADTHIGHKNIRRYCPESRGHFDTVEEMDTAIIDGINETVGKNRLVILGDIAMGKIDASLARLAHIEASEIVLIPGNHDRWSLAYAHKGDPNKHAGVRAEWGKRYEEPFNGRAITYRDTQPSSWKSLFVLTGDEKHLDGPLHDVVFSHYPCAGESREGGEDRYQWLRPAPSEIPLIHGHVHQMWKENGNQLNVGIDAPGRGFKPWSEEEIEAWLLSI